MGGLYSKAPTQKGLSFCPLSMILAVGLLYISLCFERRLDLFIYLLENILLHISSIIFVSELKSFVGGVSTRRAPLAAMDENKSTKT